MKKIAINNEKRINRLIDRLAAQNIKNGLPRLDNEKIRVNILKMLSDSINPLAPNFVQAYNLCASRLSPDHFQSVSKVAKFDLHPDLANV